MKSSSQKSQSLPDLPYSCPFSSVIAEPLKDTFIVGKFPYHTMTTRLAYRHKLSRDDPVPIFSTNSRNKGLEIEMMNIHVGFFSKENLHKFEKGSHHSSLVQTCSKSWKLDLPLPNHLSLSHRETMCSWLFFAGLVIIATGVMHCCPYNLKYKNSLA